MIQCILDKLCESNQLLDEKIAQAEELVLQTESVCEKLDAVLDPDAECPPCPEVEG